MVQSCCCLNSGTFRQRSESKVAQFILCVMMMEIFSQEVNINQLSYIVLQKRFVPAHVREGRAVFFVPDLNIAQEAQARILAICLLSHLPATCEEIDFLECAKVKEVLFKSETDLCIQLKTCQISFRNMSSEHMEQCQT